MKKLFIILAVLILFTTAATTSQAGVLETKMAVELGYSDKFYDEFYIRMEVKL